MRLIDFMQINFNHVNELFSVVQYLYENMFLQLRGLLQACFRKWPPPNQGAITPRAIYEKNHPPLLTSVFEKILHQDLEPFSK